MAKSKYDDETLELYQDILKEDIASELFNRGFVSGDLWSFSDYHSFYNDSLNDIEKDRWEPTIESLCADGFFTAEKKGDMYSYRLTQIGEEKLLVPKAIQYFKYDFYNNDVTVGEWTAEQQASCQDYISKNCETGNKYWDKAIKVLCKDGFLTEDENGKLFFVSEKLIEENRQQVDEYRKEQHKQLLPPQKPYDYDKERWSEEYNGYNSILQLFPNDFVAVIINGAFSRLLREDNEFLNFKTRHTTVQCEGFEEDISSLKLLKDEEKICEALEEYYISLEIFLASIDALEDSSKQDDGWDFFAKGIETAMCFVDVVAETFGATSKEKAIADKCFLHTINDNPYCFDASIIARTYENYIYRMHKEWYPPLPQQIIEESNAILEEQRKENEEWEKKNPYSQTNKEKKQKKDAKRKKIITIIVVIIILRIILKILGL